VNPIWRQTGACGCEGRAPAPEPAPVVAYCSTLDDDNDKDIIKPEYYPKLDNNAKAIKNRPEIAIEVHGHTSKTGSYKHNIDLSERRAKAVKDYLIDGYRLPNVTLRGYGWTQPIVTNETEEGRANNRRVQLEVDDKPQAPR
jgi:OOP family OmpA-OmpF porin